MKFLLFGTGDYYSRYKTWFDEQEVLALLDNSISKQHTFVDGIEILPPQEGIKLKYDMIVILSFYVKEMTRQLISLGVDEHNIYHFFDLHCVLAKFVKKRPLQYCINARDSVEGMRSSLPKILLLSHDLTLGGPGIALFHAARILKKQGYDVVFGSMWDGPLKTKLIESNIPVVVDENLQISTMHETKWVDTFSLLICNTMNYHVFLSERNIEIPVIWWLHDARFFYDGVNRDVIGKISVRNLKTVSVGPIPSDAFREFRPDIECSELLYGVEDHVLVSEFCRDRPADYDKICFIMIGFFEEIKGQDILVQAIKRLSPDIRNQCFFKMVGHDKTLFGERIHKESIGIGEICFIGSVDRQEIHQLLSGSDVLVCPSRQDSMPTVAAEAMMHAVPCIVSDTTGTAAYIHDGEDGFIIPSGNAQVLAERIAWCVANKNKLGSMGKRARKLYEKYFSMSAFEERFMEVIHEMLGQA